MIESQFTHQGDEDKQAAQACAKSARLLIEDAHIRYGGWLGPDCRRSFIVASARQAGEAFLAEQNRQRVNTDGMASASQFSLNVVNGKVAFPQSDNELAHPIASRGLLGPGAWLLKEAFAFVGVVAELMTEDAKGARRVGKTPRDLRGREAIDKKGAKGFVLAMQNGFRSGEKPGSLFFR
jgi:hypothetical protein